MVLPPEILLEFDVGTEEKRKNNHKSVRLIMLMIIFHYYFNHAICER